MLELNAEALRVIKFAETGQFARGVILPERPVNVEISFRYVLYEEAARSLLLVDCDFADNW